MSFIPFNLNQCNHNHRTKNLGGCYSHIDDDKPCLESNGDAGKSSVARQLPQSVVCSTLLVGTHSSAVNNQGSTTRSGRFERIVTTGTISLKVSASLGFTTNMVGKWFTMTSHSKEGLCLCTLFGEFGSGRR